MSPYRNENGAEFHRLFRESGLKAVQVAEMLKLSKSAISNYLSGRSAVTDRSLQTFREKLVVAMAETILPESDVQNAAAMLHDLHTDDPENFHVVAKVISSYHSNRRRKVSKSASPPAVSSSAKSKGAHRKRFA